MEREEGFTTKDTEGTERRQGRVEETPVGFRFWGSLRLSFLACCLSLVVGCPGGPGGDRVYELAPHVYLGWGGWWNILDARQYHSSVPKEHQGEPSRGRIVAIERVDRLAVVDGDDGRYVVGIEGSGRYFLMSMRPLHKDEQQAATVQRFDSKEQWLVACRNAGIENTELHTPDEASKDLRLVEGWGAIPR